VKHKPGARAKSRKRAKPPKPKKAPKPKKPRQLKKARKAVKPRPSGTSRSRVRRRVAPSGLRRAPNAEDDLLELARALAAVARAPAADDGGMEGALLQLETAFAGGGLVPRRFFRTWLRTRGDKTATLALAWAREQVRRGLGEVLERERAHGRVRGDVSPETLSWLILAASEAMAHESPGASGDRIAMMLEFLRPPEGP